MDTDDDDIFEIISMVFMLHEARECLDEMGSRRFWVRPEYQDRDTKGFFALHFDKMYEKNTQQFKKTVGMSKEVFDLLYGFVRESLTKNSNRPSITPKCRLFLTLAYLCHGGSRQMLSDKFKMGLTTVKRIVGETCDVIWQELSYLYICPPQGNEWVRTSGDYESLWKLPNCVGALDARHINLVCSTGYSSSSNKVKGKHSIVLLAVCDTNHVFTNFDIGIYSLEGGDGSVSWKLDFGKQLFNGKPHLPDDSLLPGSGINFPYYMIGDSAFPLKTCLMRPYPGNQLPPDRMLFNQRLTNAHSVIDNAFGILATRFKILQSPMHMSPTSAEQIVKATVLLHNFLKVHDDSYCPPGYVDQYEGNDIIEGVWRQEISNPLQKHGRMTSNNATQNAFKLRDDLTYYLNTYPL